MSAQGAEPPETPRDPDVPVLPCRVLAVPEGELNVRGVRLLSDAVA
jgi:hypothetical protein